MHSSGSESESGTEPEIGYRYATAADIEGYYGFPQKETIRAYVWTLDGEVEGVIGLVRQGNHMVFFSDVSDRLLPLLERFAAKRVFIKAMEWVKATTMPVYAVAVTGQGYKGHELLTKLGFTQYDEDYFIWLGSN